MDMEKEKTIVIRGMEAYGGSFIEHLAMALRCADRNNTQKIKTAWPEEWAQYLMMGKTL